MLSYARPPSTGQAWRSHRHSGVRCGPSLFGDRPPLRDTLTGGRPPGRKVPDPNWGLDDNKVEIMGGEIATVPENRSETYCGMRLVPFW